VRPDVVSLGIEATAISSETNPAAAGAWLERAGARRVVVKLGAER
jgi:sugar/nucleoside kinase (ribokinase family)